MYPKTYKPKQRSPSSKQKKIPHFIKQSKASLSNFRLKSNQKDENQERFKSPISKQKSVLSRSSILSINSSGDKSQYKNSQTRAKYLRNSQRRKTSKKNSSVSLSKESKKEVNRSSILMGHSLQDKSRASSLVKKRDGESEVNSVLLESEMRNYCIGQVGESPFPCNSQSSFKGSRFEN